MGKPFSVLEGGRRKLVYGWQGIQFVRYPELGWRLFGYCDIPDLELFPARYEQLRELRFVAGHEVKVLHFGTWALSWMVRLGLVKSLAPHAERLLRWSFHFDRFGSDKSGFHMVLSGTGADGRAKETRIFIIARRVHGPYIPCIPAILLAKRLAKGEAIEPGARPCLDLIDLHEYLRALEGLDISLIVEGADAPA